MSILTGSSYLYRKETRDVGVKQTHPPRRRSIAAGMDAKVFSSCQEYQCYTTSNRLHERSDGLELSLKKGKQFAICVFKLRSRVMRAASTQRLEGLTPEPE